MTELLFYWQKCCLALEGDTQPCYSPCKRCSRMGRLMMQEFEPLRVKNDRLRDACASVWMHLADTHDRDLEKIALECRSALDTK